MTLKLSGGGSGSGISQATGDGRYARLATGNVFTPDASAGAGIRVTSPAFADNTHAAIYIEDNTPGNANSGRLIEVEHRGAGAQAYALDIHNYPGATAAVVVHQYSNLDAGVQLDNCASQSVLTMRNTQNTTLAPGTQGTGHYLDLFGDAGTVGAPNVTRWGVLTKDLEFVGYNAAKPWTWKPNAGVAMQAGKFVQAEAHHGIEVTRSGTDATHAAIRVGNASTGPGVQIDQTGAQNGLYVVQSGAKTAVSVNVQAGAAGFYAVDVTGQDYGPRFTTATNSGDSLTITKNGTGAGRAMLLTNKGTGNSLEVADATSSRLIIDAAGKVTKLNNATVTMTAGAGSPEGAVTAPVGSTYQRTDGGAATSFYVKETGVGNTGWVAK